MSLIQRYIPLLLLLMCSISSFSQSKEPILTIYISYADTISQELVDSIYRQEGRYILSYHPKMAHLIPDLRCRVERIPDPCRTITVKGVTFNMMCVEGGAFMMGAADNDTEAEADECPRHKVTLSDFLIGETEVTQELWTAVMGSNPSYTKGDKLPVERVSFYDSQEFISKLNALIGLYFRLPTEAEWEYAARGGKKSHRYRYAGSNNIDQVAWTPENSGNKTHVVAEKLPNELGIYDMTGNVWEFCLDWYGEYLEENQINPIESITRNYYVCRGCAAFGNSGYSNENYFRITNRGIAWPDYQYNNVGFRLVLDAHQYVDLGLSVKWATCNVGATAPEEYGDYFAWGETEPKETYSWETYKWCDGTKQNITKYNAEDGLMNLLPEDDAAHANWGGQWRMPTAAEQAELLEYCIWEKMTVNGVIGSKVTGPNGNSIFIPLGGSYNTFDNQLNSVGQHGWIYSSTKSSADNKAREMSLSSNGGTQTICSRCIGLNIRPVILTDREPLPPITPAKRIGVFSVAKDRQVSFAQGNLQYVNSRREWRFADNQWDYLCEKNTEGKYIDLFDWTADASGSFFDWGQYEIQGDTVKTWRTLTIDEWKYLLHDRPRATELLGAATVNGVVGLVVLPDDWQLPEEVDFVSVSQENHVWKEGEKLYRFYEDIYLHNVFTSSSWQLMEQAGAVFLPASGYLDKTGLIQRCNSVARYWSSTPHNYAKGYYMSFGFHSESTTRTIRTYSCVNSDKGHSVRLVHDTIVPPPAPCETFEVNGVTFNMMCVDGGTFVMGEGKDAHQVTLSDYYMGETEVTQALWKAVMEKKTPSGQIAHGDDYPVANISFEKCREFVSRLSKLTGRNFRLPTEAEWEYAARGGQRSKGFKYSGSDNLAEVAIYRDVLQKDENGKLIHELEPVKSRKPNELGIYEMSGNLCEWVNDWNGPYNLYPQINPTGAAFPQDSQLKYIIRGGCWIHVADYCTPFRRLPFHGAAVGVGFRLVMSDEESSMRVYINDTTRFYLRLIEGEEYDYYIGQTEVTQALWKAVMGYNNSFFVGDNLPVEKVSWDECQLFIEKLNEMTGLHFRLPTEAEWEYAARGGKYSNGYMYAGSNHIDSVAWYGTNSQQTTHIVASLMPNELGIYDMTGNVWEWCQDFYDNDRTMHVVKSGSLVDVASTCRINARTGRVADYQSYIGLRLVLDAHQYVDLGLSVKWATCNVGASAPEEYGDYFAWGEVEPKDSYSWKNYKWCDGTVNTITKYNAEDGLTTLLPEDDAAHVNWGGQWRMPSVAEMTELREKCTWTWTSQNGVNGYKVTGPNGNSIFLPAAGYEWDENEEGGGSYWCNMNNGQTVAYCLRFTEKSIESRRGLMCCGVPIRPVLSKTSKTYYYSLTDEQFNTATSIWNMPNRGWGIADQTPIQGRVLHGIRLKVHTPGVLHIYKVPSLTETTEENFVKVATVTASATGLQDIDFAQPFYLGENEYLVIGSLVDDRGLVGYFSAGETTLQPFYNRVGQSGGGKIAQSLMIDFY